MADAMLSHEDDDVREDIQAMIDKKKRSRKPGNSNFKQQRLSAWKPILTPSNVVPTFFGIGVLFSIIGGAMIGVNNQAREIEIDYTDCVSLASQEQGGSETCKDVIQDFAYRNASTLNFRCSCKVDFDLAGLSGGEAYLYYGLDKFFQNHRRYVRSRDDLQLRADAAKGGEDCEPLIERDGKYFAPCGLISNSLFNDTILLRDSDGNDVGITGEAIAWPSDRNVKFHNPDSPDDDLCNAPMFNTSVALSPPNWPVQQCRLGAPLGSGATMCTYASYNQSADSCEYNPWAAEFNSNGIGYENEDLIVWMRTALVSNFKKLWRRMPNGIPDGGYSAYIDYNFPTSSFSGRKRIVFATATAIGGKSSFMPGLYVFTGVLSICTGTVFVIMRTFRSTVPAWMTSRAEQAPAVLNPSF